MLCCTSVLSSVLSSIAQGLRRAALCCAADLYSSGSGRGLRELLYAVLYICAVICAQISGPRA